MANMFLSTGPRGKKQQSETEYKYLFMKRRTFFRSGIAGAAGITMLGTPVLAGSGRLSEGEIVYRTLGRTGLKLPVVSFGVMRSDNNALVKAAYESGMKMFDTAHGYMNGRNEEMLGGFFSQVPAGYWPCSSANTPSSTRISSPRGCR